jgi:drug/metabolite transporter (DMT)-like permease
MNWTQTGEMAAMGTALLWTLSALAWTSAGKSIGVFPVSFIRLLITCLFLALYGGLVRGIWLPTDADVDTWLTLGLSGFAGFFLADLCLFKSFLLIGPRLSLLIYSLAPPATTIIAWLLLDDLLVARQWLGMGVTLAGVGWVVLEEPEGGQLPHDRRVLALGTMLAVLGAMGQAVGNVLSKKGLGDYDPVAATFIRVLGSLAGYFVLATLLRQWTVVATATRNGRAMLIVTLGAIVGPFLGVILYMIALGKCQAGVVATIVSTMPVLILPFSIVLYRERVSWRAAGGAVLSVVGVAMLVWR